MVIRVGRLLTSFYDGLTYEELKFVEMICNGDFLQKILDEAFEFLEDAAEKSHTWKGPNPTKSTSRNQTLGIYQLKEGDGINVKLALIIRKLEALEAKESRTSSPVSKVKAQACSSCGGVDHMPNECPMFMGDVNQGNAIGFPSRFCNTFNQ